MEKSPGHGVLLGRPRHDRYTLNAPRTDFLLGGYRVADARAPGITSPRRMVVHLKVLSYGSSSPGTAAIAKNGGLVRRTAVDLPSSCRTRSRRNVAVIKTGTDSANLIVYRLLYFGHLVNMEQARTTAWTHLTFSPHMGNGSFSFRSPHARADACITRGRDREVRLCAVHDFDPRMYVPLTELCINNQPAPAGDFTALRGREKRADRCDLPPIPPRSRTPIHFPRRACLSMASDTDISYASTAH